MAAKLQALNIDIERHAKLKEIGIKSKKSLAEITKEMADMYIQRITKDVISEFQKEINDCVANIIFEEAVEETNKKFSSAITAIVDKYLEKKDAIVECAFNCDCNNPKLVRVEIILKTIYDNEIELNYTVR